MSQLFDLPPDVPEPAHLACPDLPQPRLWEPADEITYTTDEE